jgi:hypothetical protein
MKRRTFLLVVTSALVALSQVALLAAEQASGAKPAKTVRLLTVGNSFSRNATHYLGDLAKAAGNTLVQHSAVISGGTMAQHWEKAERFEKDPQDPGGLYSTKRSLKQELQAEPWDFVTIQQASTRSHDLATYRPYASRLQAYSKRYASEAEVLVHQTWAYRCDDRRFSPTNSIPGEPITQEAMYQGLTRAYRTIAVELGAHLLPVGDAFHLADTDPQWGFRPDPKFDPKRAQPPTLPDQTHSLHQGWWWKGQKNGKSTLAMDGHHANAAGEYLGACVWYEVLFRDSVVGNTFIPAGVDPAYARFLQETAHRAVADLQARKSNPPN